jgi:hypothetical protein
MYTLPKLTNKFVEKFRNRMLGQGYAVINTSAFFKNTFNVDWYKINKDRYVNEWDFPYVFMPEWSKEFFNWHKRLLEKALPEENIRHGCFSFRETKRQVKEPSIEKPHIDGSYIRSITFFEGDTTVFCLKKGNVPLPLFKTCIFTAKLRSDAMKINGTKHFKPITKNPRKLLVVGFDGRIEDHTIPTPAQGTVSDEVIVPMYNELWP